MNTKKKNIIWLVSYPKSGNTWVRIFLQHIIGNVSIDSGLIPPLHNIPIASNRVLIDRLLGVASSNLTADEIKDLLPSVYCELSAQNAGIQVLKLHDSFGRTSQGEPIFPHEITHSAIYIVRNPLDIVVSYSFPSGKPFASIIDQLNDPMFEISRSIRGLKPQVIQHLGSWSEHVSGWTKQKKIPVIILTFEQLLKNSSNVFRDLLDQLKIPYEEKTFGMALEACDFSRLRKQEAENGFREKPLQAQSFFRSGKQDDYSNYLSNEQIERVIKTHHHVMDKFGYLKAKI